jgi:hypothetical protein
MTFRESARCRAIMSAESRARHKAPDAGRAGDRAVFRHRIMTTGFAVGSVLLLLGLALIWSQSPPNSSNIVGTGVLAVGLWFIWAGGWWTKVVVSGDRVFIDNVFLQHVIPWNVFTEFSVDGGLVASLSDGSRVRPVSFGGSLAGAVTGYSGMSRKRDAIMESCREYRAGGKPVPGGGHCQLIRSHWLALLMYLIPLVAIAVVIDASRHVL